ncbi:hypothetical protein GGR56DRAFT_671795 [Xylariaceae sp. FL0804]|nr:hypothetical protein GGR56DRAFT_671795 [Xylariaceae sp. FL0804]
MSQGTVYDHQVPINGTIQVQVGPGYLTGLYYVLLSNQLKDHVRQVCAVEQVQVFQKSTTGWVCVKGLENFEKAYGLLNGGLFGDRPIFATDKNANEPVWIKKHVQNPTTPKKAGLGSPASTMTPSDWGAFYPQQNPPGDQSFYAQPETYEIGSPVPNNGSLSHGVPTARRKIILKKLPAAVDYYQAEALVLQKAGSDAGKVQCVELPLASSTQANKGYAFITLRTEGAASRLIEKLHGARYQSSILSASLTKEGVSRNEQNYPRPQARQHHSSRHSRDNRDSENRKKKEKKDKSKASGSSSNTKENVSPEPTVVIANGSSATPPRRSSRV